MITINLDECLAYVYDEESEAEKMIEASHILRYLDYPVDFDGCVAKSFTLRKLRGLLSHYPLLCAPYVSLQAFMNLTERMGFKVVGVSEDRFEKIIIGKATHVRKMDLTLIRNEVIEQESVIMLNQMKMTRMKFRKEFSDKPNITVRMDCYAKGKIAGRDEYNSLGMEKLISLYDLPIELIRDRYVEYHDRTNESRDDLITGKSEVDIYLEESSLTLKELLDAIDLDIEFWEDEDVEALSEAVKDQQELIKKEGLLRERNERLLREDE